MFGRLSTDRTARYYRIRIRMLHFSLCQIRVYIHRPLLCFRFRWQHSRDADGIVKVSLSQLSAVVGIFHPETVVAVRVLLTVHISMMHSLGACFAAVTHGCGREFSSIHHTSMFSEHCLIPHERLHHRSIHALDGYRRLPKMYSWASAPDASRCVHELLLGDAFGECFIG